MTIIFIFREIHQKVTLAQNDSHPGTQETKTVLSQAKNIIHMKKFPKQ